MIPSIKISETVLKRLSETREACFGKLYGTFLKDTLTVVGLQTYLKGGIDFIHSFPAEVDFCGVFQVSDGSINQSQVKTYIHDIDVTDNPLFISCKLGTPNEIDVNIINNGQIEKTQYVAISEHDIYSEFVHIRLKGEIPIKCEVSVRSIEETFQKVRKSLSLGVIIFTFPKTNVFLLGNESVTSIIGISGHPSVGDICEESNGAEGLTRKKKSQNFDLDVLTINMLRRVTKEGQSTLAKEHAPICVLEKKSLKSINTTVIIDSLAMIHRQTKVADLYEVLLESAIRYLRLYEKNLIYQLYHANADLSSISLLQPFHFYSPIYGHFLTRLYPKNDAEDGLIKSHREFYHKQLMIDVMRPVFRRANRYMFKGERNSNGPLINPHEGVKPTDNGGEISLVNGKYEYYHYCQNNMDDNGWGCAYRSLQTLASWFKLQGYIDKEVPTYKDIQKCLVDIGDKPSSFIGSKQWIGSTEVNFVLNTLLGVTCKILYVSSGEEMGSKGPELVHHFKTHGSPIMIGGGVLAHTILGVDYNQQTGSLKFLILDPHYTGSEDLHVIQSKGWCGWKGVNFWEKSAYYNMCLPQVPREI